MAEEKSQPRISGYLEKKCKKKMMTSYKKYWFVLEGRLLLYYRSKDEYDAISPCKGSINLGPPCLVKPCSAHIGVFLIETRISTITLRASDLDVQNKWMHAIMSALNQNNQNPSRLTHFRYSSDDINNFQQQEDEVEDLQHKNLQKQNSQSNLIQRLQKIGAHTYGGSLGAICKIAGNIGSSMSSDSINQKKTLSQSSFSVVNDEYGALKSSSSGSVQFRKIVPQSQEHLYETVSQYSGSPENPYSVPNQISETRTTILMQNEHYCGVDQIITFPNTDSEVIYTEPKCCGDKIDYNENVTIDSISKSNRNSSLIVDNPDYDTTTPTTEYINNSNIYEYLDFNEEETSSQGSDKNNTGKKKRFQSIRRKLGLSKEPKEPKSELNGSNSIKKSQSFIQRVWKRKKRDKQSGSVETEEEDDIYEVPPKIDIEKIELANDHTVKLLSELQNILENKKPLLLQKLSNSRESQNIHQTKTEDDNLSCPRSPKIEEEECPNIPPKQKSESINQYENLPPPKSIDEILDDLDKEKGRAKIKTLIKRFDENEVIPDEDVVLRKHDSDGDDVSTPGTQRYSDELTRLLDELAKVTSAPILQPGGTMSLISPHLTDDELLKLIPIRKRRMSEPDYDVPRPHRSLINLSQKDANIPGEQAIPVTTFFGPFLPQEEVSCDSPVCISITPDSLEPNVQLSKVTKLPISPNLNDTSYTSHNYYQDGDDDKFGKEKNRSCDEFTIYAHPKPLQVVTTLLEKYVENQKNTILHTSFKTIDIKDDNISNDKDVFVDSLELPTEISTAF